ncbi:pentapeptide repeat-containing protein [Plantactinospora sp. WMMC1484]|uniref:pentapeptide repeat-containing protein n=1 Tax=Plantactinospora sp. WMMC1484 TaxID=3404122 RepID=UPI003BF5AA80
MKLPAADKPARSGAHVAPSPVLPTQDQVPALRLSGIGWAMALPAVSALVVAFGLFFGALWYADWPDIQQDGSVKVTTLFELVKLIFAVVAGVGGVAALVVAYRRQRVAEHQNALAHADGRRAENADKRAKIETDRNGARLFNERFTKASEQLGSEKAAVRLAGVYAMAGLADDWREGRQTCIDVLCAYLRMPYIPTPDAPDEAPAQADDQVPIVAVDPVRAAREEREVRHTVIRLVGRHLRLSEDDATSWRGYDFDFTGAVFDGGNFSDAMFDGGQVSFAEALFIGGNVSFVGARFTGGWVSFDRAMFTGAEVDFVGALFSGGRVSFVRAVFSGGAVSFDGAQVTGGRVHFGKAVFSGGAVSFDGAEFSGGAVHFARAVFSGGAVSFNSSVFGGGLVSLQGAAFQTPPTFDDWPGGHPPGRLILPGA